MCVCVCMYVCLCVHVSIYVCMCVSVGLWLVLGLVMLKPELPLEACVGAAG